MLLSATSTLEPKPQTLASSWNVCCAAVAPSLCPPGNPHLAEFLVDTIIAVILLPLLLTIATAVLNTFNVLLNIIAIVTTISSFGSVIVVMMTTMMITI